MTPTHVYKSKQRAFFEAWIQDGLYYKQDKSYHVVTKEAAKNRVRKFIEKGDFASVKDIAEQFKSPVTLSERNIAKSLRVSFLTYAKLVESALKQETSLSTLVRNIMVKDLGKFTADAKNRKDVVLERLNLFRNAFKNWQKDSLKAGHSPRASYSPSNIYYPYMSKELIRTILDKAFEEIKSSCSSVPAEVLDRYLEVDWEESIKELHENWPEFFDLNMHLNQNGQLVLNISYSPYAILDMNLEEYEVLNREMSNKYGSEAIKTLNDVLNIDKEFFDDETQKLPTFLRVNLISIPLEIAREALLVNSVAMKGEHSYDKIKRLYKESKDEHVATMKSRLDKGLKQEDWEVVSTVSDNVVQIEKDYQLRDYGLEIAFRLFRKTQVISFRAPEVIVRAWEAYGKIDYDSLDSGE